MARQRRRRTNRTEAGGHSDTRRILRRAAAGLLVGAIAVAVVAVGLSPLGGGADGADQVPAARRDPGAPDRDAAPDFVVALSGGEEFRLSAHRGRVVVLEFLASGCPSCAAELSALSRVAENFEDSGVVVLVLDVGGLPPDSVAGYYQGLGGGNHLLYAPDEDLRTAQQYGVQFLGTTVVLNGDGREVYRDGAGTREVDLVAAIEDGS